MPAAYLSFRLLSANFLLLIFLQFELKTTPCPIQEDLMIILENVHQTAHMGAGAWDPGSAVRHHQLSTDLTKNGVAIIYANDCISLSVGRAVMGAIFACTPTRTILSHTVSAHKHEYRAYKAFHLLRSHQ